MLILNDRYEVDVTWGGKRRRGQRSKSKQLIAAWHNRNNNESVDQLILTHLRHVTCRMPTVLSMSSPHCRALNWFNCSALFMTFVNLLLHLLSAWTRVCDVVFSYSSVNCGWELGQQRNEAIVRWNRQFTCHWRYISSVRYRWISSLNVQLTAGRSQHNLLVVSVNIFTNITCQRKVSELSPSPLSGVFASDMQIHVFPQIAFWKGDHLNNYPCCQISNNL